VRACTFRAWDQTSGVVGGTADTSVNGGISAFSENVDVVYISVAPVNDAPVLDPNHVPSLYSVEVGADPPFGSNVGTPIGKLVDFASPSGQVDNVTDVDAGAKLGIAIPLVQYKTSFKGYYTVDSGATWTPIGTRSLASALLLADDGKTRVFFQPN